MRYFDMYESLLGVPYDDGDHDCYGLCRRYYEKNYGMSLPNYARSADFFSAGIDLVSQFLLEADFAVVDVPLSRMEPGDGLLLCVPVRGWPQSRVNHVGVFVGNGTFIHHLWGKESCEDYLDATWARRILSVVRHPDIAEKNAAMIQATAVDFLSMLPDHVKRKHGLSVETVLDATEGASGAATPGSKRRRAAKPKRNP